MLRIVGLRHLRFELLRPWGHMGSRTSRSCSSEPTTSSVRPPRPSPWPQLFKKLQKKGGASKLWVQLLRVWGGQAVRDCKSTVASFDKVLKFRVWADFECFIFQRKASIGL